MSSGLKNYVLEFDCGADAAGKFYLKDRHKFREQIPLFTGRDDLEMLIRIKRSFETSQIRKYYFGVVVSYIVHCFREDGWDADQKLVHAFLKKQFAYEEIPNHLTGEIMQVALSTSKMSVDDFCKYIDRIIRWAAEKGWTVPPADTNYRITT